MSTQITEAMVQQYNSNVQLLSQQKQSRLRHAVRVETIHAEYEYFDQIGPVEAQPRGGRHSDTPLMNTPHLRRRVTASAYNWADLIDKPDKLRMLYDPTSPYAVNAVMAFNRAMDNVIITEAFGTAYTGKEGKTPITFPASQTITAGDTGLTLDKLIKCREMFWKNEVDETIPLYMAVTSAQLGNLLRTTEVTSADYSSVKALVHGEINTFMGFEFIRFEGLPWASNVRDCLAWAKDGLLLAVAEDITTRISERGDKNYSVQVYAEMDLGATRMEEAKVIKVQCSEAAA